MNNTAAGSDSLKIYFCGSIRGGRNDAQLYHDLIEYLKTIGKVLSEHVGRLDLVDEREIPPCQIHDRDLVWLKSADVVIAEVSTPSLGVGYELGRAVEMGKPILCLFMELEEFPFQLFEVCSLQRRNFDAGDFPCAAETPELVDPFALRAEEIDLVDRCQHLFFKIAGWYWRNSFSRM